MAINLQTDNPTRARAQIDACIPKIGRVNFGWVGVLIPSNTGVSKKGTNQIQFSPKF